MEHERAKAIATYLGMIIDRVADRASSLCRWGSTREETGHTFGTQTLSMTWDFAETNPFGGSSGDLAMNVDSSGQVIEHCAKTGEPARVLRGSADESSF